jgi:hypothetical protein
MSAFARWLSFGACCVCWGCSSGPGGFGAADAYMAPDASESADVVSAEATPPAPSADAMSSDSLAPDGSASTGEASTSDADTSAPEASPVDSGPPAPCMSFYVGAGCWGFSGSCGSCAGSSAEYLCTAPATPVDLGVTGCVQNAAEEWCCP